MIVTSSGRPVGKFPVFKWSDRRGHYLLFLSRIDVSDTRNRPHSDAFYTPHLVFENNGGLVTISVRMGERTLIIFISPKRFNFYVNHETTE